MASNLTRQVSIGFSSKPTQGHETTLYKSWSHPFGSAARRGSEALFVLLLESVEPLPTGSKLLAQVGEAVRKALGQESIERHTTAERMSRAIQSANDLLLREQTKTPQTPTHRISVMLAALMPAADAGCEVVIAHVGACRAFLRRNKHIEPLTVPHTWGQENVMSGIIDAKDEDDEGRYPYWRRPTRYLGVAQTVAVDFTMDAKRSDSLGGDAVRSLKLQRSDSLLLCSSRLTAASLSREAGHIDAGSASALARQLTDRAAMPSGNGAAAVVVTWSNGLQPLPVAVGAIALGVLVLLAWGFISSSASTGASTVTASPTNGPSASPDSPTPPTDTPGPTEGPSLTPTSTATSAPMPTSTATPTPRPSTATPAPTATSTPTAPPTSTSTTTATATVMPTPTADEFVVSEFQVVLLTPSPDLTVKEQNKTVQFVWSPSAELPVGFEYELVFWFDGMDPETKGQGPVGSGRDTSTPVTFPVKLFDKLITNQDICWGIRLWPVEAGSNTHKVMLSNGCRVLKIRLESERPADPGSSTQGATGGTPCVENCN